ncbi:receptor-type tyrosine-protein phosphatase eta [Amia ocellicauda]|uniref:receptor-type tyrosine-protein phosphatase eta n=1 Tax=Amia ocellicauda TaxID=2972642 RepID=UPI0034639534
MGHLLLTRDFQLNTLVALVLICQVSSVLSDCNFSSPINYTIETTTITFQFNDPECQIRNVSGMPSGPNISSSTTNIISGLSPGNTYEVTLNCSCSLNVTTKPGVIGNLTVTDVTTSSVSLNWTKPQGNSSFFRVEVLETGTITNTTETFIIMTGLTSGGKYTFRVTAVASDNSTEGAAVNVFCYTKPGVIGNLTVTDVTTSSVSLNWTKPQGNSSFFRVEVLETGTITNTTETFIIMTGLTSGGKYTFRVTAVASDNSTEGAAVNVFCYTKPGVIGNLTVTDVTTSSVSLNWTKPQGNSSFFRVEVLETGTITNTTETFIIMTGLTSGGKYKFRVTAVASDNSTEGAAVNVFCYTKPGVIGNLTVTDVTTSSVSLNWTKPQGNSSFFRVEVLETGTITNTTETFIIMTGLTSGGKYKFRVTAVASDNSTEGAAVNVFCYTKPGVIGNLTVTDVTTSSVSLNWTKPQGNSSFFRVEVLETGTITNTTETFIIMTGLTSGGKYKFRVTAVASDNSTEGAAVNVSCYTRPNPVQNLTSTVINTSSVMLQWQKPVNYSSDYTYSVKVSNSSYTQTNTTVSETLTVGNLESGTNYTFTVTTLTEDGTEASSSSVSCYTRPFAIENLTATTINITTIQLTWKQPQGYKPYYKYLVTINNQPNVTLNETSFMSTGLTPGTPYSFSVFTLVANETNEDAKNISAYTKPAAVNANNIQVSSNGNTRNMKVSWKAPVGNVESYNVTIYRNNDFQKTKNTNITNETFYNLRPGRIYNVTVTTISGPFAQSSDVVPNATYPEAPTNITIFQKTNVSMCIQWGTPLDMGDIEHQFSVTYLPRQISTITSNTTIKLGILQSGTQYNISVVTIGEMGFLSVPATVSGFTRPFAIENLTATTINITTIQLTWKQPQGYKPYYKYLVTINNEPNVTLNETSFMSTGLTPGTPYSFSVFTLVANETNEDAKNISAYTKPAAVNANNIQVSSNGNTRNMKVSWKAPVGNVESYNVTIYRNNDFQKTKNTNITNETFYNLRPGRIYNVTVTTISGPFAQSSDVVPNATYPEAPTNITIFQKTNVSMCIQWGTPLDMGDIEHQFSVTYLPGQISIISSNTTIKLGILQSGTQYNISVVTIGEMGFLSVPATVSGFTRPMSVNSLHAGSVSTEIINLLWTKPDYYKPSYQYRVNSTDNVSVVKTESYNATGLIPGKQYNFTVTTLTSDNTEGESNMISVCTNAAEVQDVKCTGPNGSLQASLEMSWTCPNGFNEGFQVFNINNQNKSVARSDCKTSKTINFTLGNLDYNKQYSMRINTLGCGEMSSPVNITCQTGITDPPPPTENIVNLLNTSVAQRFDTFIVAFNSQLFSDQNGPIVAYGVLISSDTQQSKPDKSSLSQTYEDWNSQKTTTYLATIVHVSASRAANIPPYSVAIGAGNTVDGYFNGKLVPRGTYRVAIAAFTKLEITSNKINVEASYVSITIFSPTVTLNENPAVIGGAVGGTLTALLILICITVIAVVYWRRRAVQKSCDVPLDSMSEVLECDPICILSPPSFCSSLPIRVEDYEGYYKKQRADSSCGFAEEFEDLKIVGTAQSKNSAEAQENKGKNRYNNVLPYDSSRVKLSIHGSAYDDYINANYMPGYNSKKEFIAAQGPLPGTVNEFWRMIWEKNVHSLVMLTRCNEQGRVKCEEYWPSGTKNYGNITVTMTSDISLEDWTLRDFNLKNMKTSEIRSLRQFHFTAWPDHGVPETTELLINFRHLVREHMDQYSRNSPTVVHCSAGVGRTGTFIAIDRLIYQIERESMVDVYGIVHDLRMHRPLMVQTEDQYIFLNNCAMDLIKARTGTNVDLIYQNTAALNIYENFDPEKAKTKNGYKV